MRHIILATFATVQLGTKPWCYQLPNTPNNCHAQDSKDCDGAPATYCIYDTKQQCEANKLYSDEKCIQNEVNNE